MNTPKIDPQSVSIGDIEDWLKHQRQRVKSGSLERLRPKERTQFILRLIDMQIGFVGAVKKHEEALKGV